MAIPKYKFILIKGEDSEKSFQWKDHLKRPIDLAGWTIECNMYSDATTLISSSSTNNGLVTSVPTEGKFTISFPRAITDSQLSSYARYEIWMTLPNGNRKCFMTGSLSFQEP